MNATNQSAIAARPGLSDRLFRIGKKLRHRVSAVVAHSSRVGDTPLYDPAIFPWIGELERRWPAIRAELAGEPGQ